MSPPGQRKAISYAPMTAYWQTHFAAAAAACKAEQSAEANALEARLEPLAKSQPIAGGGNGTVHRLSIDTSTLPASLPETELSVEQLAAPAPTAR